MRGRSGSSKRSTDGNSKGRLSKRRLGSSSYSAACLCEARGCSTRTAGGSRNAGTKTAAQRLRPGGLRSDPRDRHPRFLKPSIWSTRSRNSAACLIYMRAHSLQSGCRGSRSVTCWKCSIRSGTCSRTKRTACARASAPSCSGPSGKGSAPTTSPVRASSSAYTVSTGPTSFTSTSDASALTRGRRGGSEMTSPATSDSGGGGPASTGTSRAPCLGHGWTGWPPASSTDALTRITLISIVSPCAVDFLSTSIPSPRSRLQSVGHVPGCRATRIGPT